MNKKLSFSFKATIPLFIGILLVYFSVKNITPSEQINIKKSFFNADYIYILISLLVGLISHFLRALNTDHNMTILIEDIAWDIIPSEGSEISAYDQKGNLVGSTKYTSPTTLLTVWGDDELSTLKDGLIVNENISFKLI